MEDLKETNNKTIEALIFQKSKLEKEIIKLEAQLELMQELFDKYIR